MIFGDHNFMTFDGNFFMIFGDFSMTFMLFISSWVLIIQLNMVTFGDKSWHVTQNKKLVKVSQKVGRNWSPCISEPCPIIDKVTKRLTNHDPFLIPIWPTSTKFLFWVCHDVIKPICRGRYVFFNNHTHPGFVNSKCV